MASDRVAQLRKGVLELAILGLLRARERYGGEIVAELAERPGLDASAGTVYPLLTRLKTSGLVDTRWEESTAGPPRKYYRLSRAGWAALADGTRAWRGLVHALDSLLEVSE
ncbi:MAG TPA: PadR family transcriptional regulator [Propionibacteriaceae bacterium]|nr:PadR family transcriptional regulator [Propionibacteriaceae bacterium]